MNERPARDLAASYAVKIAPAQQAVDELLFLDVDIKNNGTQIWSHQGRGTFSLSYRWRDSNGQFIPGEGLHIALDRSVAPGQTVAMELPIEPPARPGSYQLAVELVQEGVAWLSELGVPSLDLPVEIVPGSGKGRVVCLINSNCWPRDAIGNHLVEQIRFFRERGDRVLGLVEDIDKRLPREVRRFLAPCSIETLRQDQPTLATRRAFEHFASAELTIVHYSAYYPLVEAIRLVGRGQVIFDYHGVTPSAIWSGVQGREELTRGEQQVRLVRYADQAIAHSSYARDELVANSGMSADRVMIMPYVVPIEAFRPHMPDAALVERYKLAGKPVLLYIGRMAANKRVSDLIRALPLVQQRFPDTVLLLVGDAQTPPYPQVVAEAQALAEELGCAEQVIFTGQVDDLPAYYQLCDLFVTASIHEGFCIPVVEAEASGKPVIGVAATALPETIGPGGLTFEPGNVTDLAEKISILLEAKLQSAAF